MNKKRETDNSSYYSGAAIFVTAFVLGQILLKLMGQIIIEWYDIYIVSMISILLGFAGTLIGLGIQDAKKAKALKTKREALALIDKMVQYYIKHETVMNIDNSWKRLVAKLLEDIADEFDFGEDNET